MLARRVLNLGIISSLFLGSQLGALSANEPGHDYFAEATVSGASRWPASRMPIKVYVAPGKDVSNYRQNMDPSLKQAFEEWANASQGKVKFQFVDDAKDAQIDCVYTNDAKQMMGTQESGQAMIVPDQDGILKADVKILIDATTPMSDEYAHRVFLHEAGHSLGILGHSPDKKDMMCGQIYPNTKECTLTERDKNTLVTLYTAQSSALAKMTVDPTKSLNSGDPASVTMRVLKLNAEASEAANKKNYTVAIDKLEEARKLDPKNQLVASNLGGVYSNCAAIAGMVFNFPLAETYFKKAIPLLEESNSTQNLLTVLKNYSNVLKMTQRASEAQKIDAKIASLQKTEPGK